MFRLSRVLPIELGKEIPTVLDIFIRFPGIVLAVITDPFDEEVEFFSSGTKAITIVGVQNLFYFELLFSFDKFGWRSGEIGIRGVLVVFSELVNVKDWMDFPFFG